MMSKRGRKGAEATAKRFHAKALDSNDLPPLDSPQAAETWLETIGRAVATGRLAHQDADAVTRAVREWLRAHDAGAVSAQLEALEATVNRLKSGKGLEVVS